MFERELDRATDVAVDAVNATAVHLRRVAGLICNAVGRTARELADMVWDYQDLAGDVRCCDLPSDRGPDAVVLELRHQPN
jgi:hypothetical protein